MKKIALSPALALSRVLSFAQFKDLYNAEIDPEWGRLYPTLADIFHIDQSRMLNTGLH